MTAKISDWELATMPGRASQGPVGGHTVASFKSVTAFLHHVVVETDSVVTGDDSVITGRFNSLLKRNLSNISLLPSLCGFIFHSWHTE